MQQPEFPRWLQVLLYALAALLVFQTWIVPAKLLGLDLTESTFGFGAIITFLLGCAIIVTVRQHSRIR